MQPRISIVIPSLAGNIDRVRASVERQTMRDWEVISVRGVRPAGRARNMGVARATGEFILFIDDDAELGNEHVLARMVAAMNAPEVGIVGSSKVLPVNSTPLQRRIAREVPRWEYPILHTAVVSNPPLDRYGFTAVTTTCCLVRRSAFEAVGGFDERLTTGEDPELFYRLRKAGYDFVMAGESWALHAPPSSLRRFLVKCFFYGVGHAQEARLDGARGMALLPLQHQWAWIVVALSPFLLLPMMFLDVRLDPGVRVRGGFRPVQAIARLATLYGYAWGWRKVNG